MRINDDALLRIVDVYKRVFAGRSFITDSGNVDFSQLMLFLSYMAQFETSILLKQEKNDARRAQFYRAKRAESMQISY